MADYDGNGFLDIAKTNFSGDLISLFKNGDGKFFTDVSQDTGLVNQLLGWETLFLDVDNDGWKDLVGANGSRRDPPFRNCVQLEGCLREVKRPDPGVEVAVREYLVTLKEGEDKPAGHRYTTAPN